MTNNQYLTLRDLIQSLNRLDKIDEGQLSKIRCLLDNPITDNVYSALCSIITKLLIESEETSEEKELRLNLQTQFLDIIKKHWCHKSYWSPDWPIKNYDVGIFEPPLELLGTKKTNIPTVYFNNIEELKLKPILLLPNL